MGSPDEQQQQQQQQLRDGTRRRHSATTSKILAIVRVRPGTGQAAGPSRSTAPHIELNSAHGTISLLQQPDRCFAFDDVLDESTTQEQVFQAVCPPLLRDLVRGVSATLFAYGQTSSGKTFTTIGEPDNRGILPRLLDQLFAKLRQEL